MARAKPKAKSRGKKTAAAAQSGAAPPLDLAAAFRQEYQPQAQPANNVVVLDADIAPHFPNSRAVNEALRAVLRIVRQVRGFTA